jgi:hypothetical protein
MANAIWQDGQRTLAPAVTEAGMVNTFLHCGQAKREGEDGWGTNCLHGGETGVAAFPLFIPVNAASASVFSLASRER